MQLAAVAATVGDSEAGGIATLVAVIAFVLFVENAKVMALGAAPSLDAASLPLATTIDRGGRAVRLDTFPGGLGDT